MVFRFFRTKLFLSFFVSNCTDGSICHPPDDCILFSWIESQQHFFDSYSWHSVLKLLNRWHFSTYYDNFVLKDFVHEQQQAVILAKDSGAGFFIEEDDEDATPAGNTSKTPAASRLVVNNGTGSLRCEECSERFDKSFLWTHFELDVCDACRSVINSTFESLLTNFYLLIQWGQRKTLSYHTNGCKEWISTEGLWFRHTGTSTQIPGQKESTRRSKRWHETVSEESSAESSDRSVWKWRFNQWWEGKEKSKAKGSEAKSIQQEDHWTSKVSTILTVHTEHWITRSCAWIWWRSVRRWRQRSVRENMSNMWICESVWEVVTRCVVRTQYSTPG